MTDLFYLPLWLEMYLWEKKEKKCWKLKRLNYHIKKGKEGSPLHLTAARRKRRKTWWYQASCCKVNTWPVKPILTEEKKGKLYCCFGGFVFFYVFLNPHSDIGQEWPALSFMPGRRDDQKAKTVTLQVYIFQLLIISQSLFTTASPV